MHKKKFDKQAIGVESDIRESDNDEDDDVISAAAIMAV